jgi:hypothetical protein
VTVPDQPPRNETEPSVLRGIDGPRRLEVVPLQATKDLGVIFATNRSDRVGRRLAWDFKIPVWEDHVGTSEISMVLILGKEAEIEQNNTSIEITGVSPDRTDVVPVRSMRKDRIRRERRFL